MVFPFNPLHAFHTSFFATQYCYPLATLSLLFFSASALRVLQSKFEVWGTPSLALRVFLGESCEPRMV